MKTTTPKNWIGFRLTTEWNGFWPVGTLCEIQGRQGYGIGLWHVERGHSAYVLPEDLKDLKPVNAVSAEYLEILKAGL